MQQNGCLPQSIKRILWAVAMFILLIAAIGTFRDAEHYARVCDQPLTVTATVTDITATEDDGDTVYRVYVSYTVDGQFYDGIEYMETKAFTRLPGRGTSVKLQVSPEDPEETLNGLLDTASGLPVAVCYLALAVGALWGWVVRSRRSKGILHAPDEETIQADLRLTVIGRRSLAYWPAAALGVGAVVMRYPFIGNETIWYVLVGVSLVIWLLCLLWARRDLQAVSEQEYKVKRRSEPQRNTVVRTGNREPWETTPKADGKRITLEVYLGKKGKPVLRYNANGDAC